MIVRLKFNYAKLSIEFSLIIHRYLIKVKYIAHPGVDECIYLMRDTVFNNLMNHATKNDLKWHEYYIVRPMKHRCNHDPHSYNGRQRDS